MQSKGLMVVVIAIIVVLIAAFGYMQLGKKSSDSSTGSQKESMSGGLPAKGSLADLMGLGRNIMCTMSSEDENGKTSGTSYVSGEKIRSDYTVVSNGQEMSGSMIYDGEYSYTWSEEQGKGTKFKISKEEMSGKTASPAPGSEGEGADLDKEADLDCSSWSVDNSKFTPPSNIEFTDFSESMMQMQEKSNDSGGSMKSACDQITDPEAKAACLQYAQ